MKAMQIANYMNNAQTNTKLIKKWYVERYISFF